MTNQQVAWAKQHDWFSSAYEGMVWVMESSPQAGLVPFHNYERLRAWAGY